MVTDNEIVEVLRDHCLAYGMKVLPRGHHRIDTKLLYPDGSAVTLFVERGDLIREEGLALSDFGNTFAKLAELLVNPWQPKSRFQAIEETVGDLGVRVFDDRLVLELNGPEDLPEGIIRLGQACIRVSCQIFTRRAAQQRDLSGEVQSVVQSTGLPYEAKYRFKGPYQNNIEVDYRVKGAANFSSILTLGSNHAQANEVFRKWSDLEHSKVADQFVTIFDDRREIDRKEDLTRLERVSEVISLSNRKGIEMLLRDAA